MNTHKHADCNTNHTRITEIKVIEDARGELWVIATCPEEVRSAEEKEEDWERGQRFQSRRGPRQSLGVLVSRRLRQSHRLRLKPAQVQGKTLPGGTGAMTALQTKQ